MKKNLPSASSVTIDEECQEYQENTCVDENLVDQFIWVFKSNRIWFITIALWNVHKIQKRERNQELIHLHLLRSSKYYIVYECMSVCCVFWCNLVCHSSVNSKHVRTTWHVMTWQWGSDIEHFFISSRSLFRLHNCFNLLSSQLF